MLRAGTRTRSTHRETLEILGVTLSFESSNQKLLEEVLGTVKRFFPFEVKRVRRRRSPHHLEFIRRNGAYIVTSEFGEQAMGAEEAKLLKHIRSLARIIVASNAPRLLFIHAGVISVNGRGIIIPGDSHSGKTSLVRELVRQGAVYYSDEYAMLDEDGLLHPFPKPLSVRGVLGPEIQQDVSVETLGGVAGAERIPISHVLLTRYRRGAQWKPVSHPVGEGVLKLVPHAIGFAKRPDFALPILQKAMKNAVFLGSDRGDVKAFSKKFLETLDK